MSDNKLNTFRSMKEQFHQEISFIMENVPCLCYKHLHIPGYSKVSLRGTSCILLAIQDYFNEFGT